MAVVRADVAHAGLASQPLRRNRRRRPGDGAVGAVVVAAFELERRDDDKSGRRRGGGGGGGGGGARRRSGGVTTEDVTLREEGGGAGGGGGSGGARNGWRLRPLRTLAGLRGHCFGLVAALPTALVALAEGGADDASGGPEGDDGALHVWDFGAAYYYGSRDGGRRRRVPAPRDAVCGETTAREHRAVPAEPAGVPLS